MFTVDLVEFELRKYYFVIKSCWCSVLLNCQFMSNKKLVESFKIKLT